MRESGGKLYSSRYEDPALRGNEERRPWNVTEELRRYARPDAVMLDIGCGSCRKILSLATEFREIYGLEPSEEMRQLAVANAITTGASNVRVIDGFAEQLPFADETFDVVSCFVAPHSTAEVFRVLKAGGAAVLEKLGDRDRANIKTFFGSDQLGPRGQFLGLNAGERERQYQEEFSVFSRISIRSGEWHTYLTREGLVKLLEETNMVRDYEAAKDSRAIDAIVNKLSTAAGIPMTHQRILIVAVK